MMKKEEISKFEKGIRDGIAGLNKKGIVSWISDLIFDIDENADDIDKYLDKFKIYRENALRKFPRQPNP